MNNDLTETQAKNLTWDFLLENDLASEDALKLITKINGFSIETLNDVIFCRTGYHDIKQIFDCEKDNFYFNNEIIANIEDDYFNLG